MAPVDGEELQAVPADELSRRRRQSIPKDRSRTGAEMSVTQSVADILNHHVTFQLECIDRMYLNVYVPMLQCESGIAKFFRSHRGHKFASSALMDPMTKAFVAAMEYFAKQQQIPLVQFRKGQRKDDVMKEHLARFNKPEGVVFIGKAQEKTPVFRTEKRRNPQTGRTYPWIVRSSAMVNHFYCYCMDREFGPFFLKFCSYFPYNAKRCLNGHEYAKCQLGKEGSDSRRWITVSFPAMTTTGCKPSAMNWDRRRLMLCCAAGWRSCHIRSRRRIGKPATVTTCRSYRRSSR